MNPELTPRRDFVLGEKAHTRKALSENDVASFANITGDFNPVHLDDEYAQKTRFRGRIVHGMLTAGLISAVLGMKLPGPGSIYLSQDLKFIRPARVGDTLTAEVEVEKWDTSTKIVGLKTRCYNQKGEDVVTGNAALLFEPQGEGSRD